MFITYDPDAGALAVELRTPERPGVSRDFGGGRYVEVDEHDRAVVFEFLGASQGIDLTGLPEASTLEQALGGLERILERRHRPVSA